MLLSEKQSGTVKFQSFAKTASGLENDRGLVVKVCFFGMYNKYDSSGHVRSPRSEILIEGLKRNGVQVVECNFPVPAVDFEVVDKLSFVSAIVRLFFMEWSGYLKITAEFFFKAGWKADAIIVGSPWKMEVFIAFFLSRIFGKPLVFDMFNSLFETAVLDRKAVKQHSLHAALLLFLDKAACFVSDIVIMDTAEHKKFIEQYAGVSPTKTRAVFVGADDRIFAPQKIKIKNKKFTVLFCGSNIPLHGISTIFDAAFLLRQHKDIEFQLIGPGHYSEWKKRLEESLLPNIKLFDFLEPKDYAALLTKCDVALGIFGGTEKAARVVPHKAFDAIACAKQLITQTSPAALEVFSDKKNALLIEPKNPKALADAILFLKKNKRAREKIANDSFKLFVQRFSPKAIGFEVKGIIEPLVSKK